jgi:hypothetical protein
VPVRGAISQRYLYQLPWAVEAMGTISVHDAKMTDQINVLEEIKDTWPTSHEEWVGTCLEEEKKLINEAKDEAELLGGKAGDYAASKASGTEQQPPPTLELTSRCPHRQPGGLTNISQRSTTSC